MISLKKKECLINFTDYKCEQCNKQFNFNELQIHRIKRKGSYEDFRNLKVLCKECHKKIHCNEFKQTKTW